MKTTSLLAILTALILTAAGCKKQDDFLNAKTNQALSVPLTLSDYQALVINENLFNKNGPVLGTITANDYYITNTTWAHLFSNTERNAYIWARDIFEGGILLNNDWNYPYQQVYVANTVLDGLSKMPADNSSQALYNEIKGTALFYRAVAFYNLVQTFSLPYDPATAQTDLGVPLRLNADLNVPSVRATVRQSYDRILKDLAEALTLLPATTSIPTRPSQIAAQAMFARIYLAISDFKSALGCANATLAQFNTLVDFNTVTPQSFTISNKFFNEDIFHASMTNAGETSSSNAIIDSALYKLYDSNDLRKTIYFYNNGNVRDRSTYDYKQLKYCGLATDEIYLIRAECYARQGDTQKALYDLNTLLAKRYKSGTFVPIAATSDDDVLTRILTERRKELVFRGLRWTDLRRLNKEERFKSTLTRVVNNVTYTLPPNDPRYAMPIPPNEIVLSGIQQNIR